MFKSLAGRSALVVTAAFLWACDPPATVQVEEEKVDENTPPARVELPDPPPSSGFTIPEKNSDSTMRVEGLIHHQDKYLDQKVEVRGVIVKLSEPCDPGKAKKNNESCPEPNMFIKDDPDAQKVLRVVGYKDEFIKKSKIEEGQTHVFKGTYVKVAQGFVATEDGLVLLDYVDDMAVLEPAK